ncbi:hypothetical protein AVEN_260851-1 [Araneus ventricosus]|uniref:Uncharacterized protein n=1 Tax=Araneus ventricosus TaxID=182803 RepID=A0A4Y2P4L4_ARAVE|nr:hypothetical protein AVEN_260851-1 [Araneus ventricosus]
MESKLIAAFLCFLGLFAIVQALPWGPEDVKKYWKCFNYANCLSDGTARQKLMKCIDNLKPEEVKSVYESIEDFYKWKSNNLHDALKEYCEINDAGKVSFLNSS